MVMMFFITGSNGIYAGADLQATLSNPAQYGHWNKEKIEKNIFVYFYLLIFFSTIQFDIFSMFSSIDIFLSRQ